MFNLIDKLLKRDISTILPKVNQIAMLIFCMWIAVPYISSKTRIVFLLLIFLVWLLTTDLKWLKEKWTLDLIFIIVFFLTFIPYFLTSKLQYGMIGPKVILVSFPLFFVGIFINYYYMFYLKDYRALGRIALFFLIFFVIGSLQTYFGLLKYPMASRELATGNLELSQLYSELGIGGFGYIYCSTFLLIAAVYSILKATHFSVKEKLVVFIPIITISLMLLRASYAISLLISFFGLISVLFVRNKLTFFLFLFITTIILIFLPKSILSEFFFFAGELFNENKILNEKFIDLAQSIHSLSGYGQTGNRMELYLSSFRAFLSNPIFGIYGPFGDANNRVIGGHSGWLDLLAFYGLFTFIPMFLIFFYNFSKQIRFYKKSKYYGLIITVYFLISLFGLINPILYIHEIGFVLFCIIPSIPFIPYAFKKKQIEKKKLGDFSNEDFMAN